MTTIEWLLLVGGGMLLISILASKLSTWLGVPALVIFLGIGMLAGSDGPGGIEFSDARLAQAVGVTALAFILFSGGWKIRRCCKRCLHDPAFPVSS